MAHFKVGDTVRYKGTNPALTGRTGRVDAVETIDGLEWVTIKDKGVTFHAPHFNWVANAKFKAGDTVVLRDGRKGRVETSAPGPMGQEMYHVRLEDGRLADSAERNLALANSTTPSGNPAVANALRARNALPSVAANAGIKTLVRTLEDCYSQMKDVSAKVGRLKEQDKALKKRVRALQGNPVFDQAYNEATGSEKKKIDDLFYNILSSSPFGAI